jgi:predicted Zn-dependent peptidase
LRGVEFSSPLRYPLSILNTAFGGGMSSRLFQGLREKKGLVYNVQSFIDLHSDCGISGFYLVCDKKNLPNVANQLREIFSDIHKNGFHKEEIELAKTYLSGNLLLSLETSTIRMLRLGRERLYLEKINRIKDIIKTINLIDATKINNMIKDFLNPNQYSVAAVGPINEDEISETFDAIRSY